MGEVLPGEVNCLWSDVYARHAGARRSLCDQMRPIADSAGDIQDNIAGSNELCRKVISLDMVAANLFQTCSHLATRLNRTFYIAFGKRCMFVRRYLQVTLGFFQRAVVRSMIFRRYEPGFEQQILQ